MAGSETPSPGLDVIFGPSGDEWRYTPWTKTYDLTRGSSQPSFSFITTHGTSDISVKIAPEKAALVVIDMQNYFLHPSCNSHPSGLAAVNCTLDVIKKCRKMGIKVIWLSWGLNDEDVNTMPAATLNSFAGAFNNPPARPDVPRGGFGSDLGDGRGRCLMLGSWNAQIYDPLRSTFHAQEDIVCPKTRVSGLWKDDTPFAEALKKHSLKTLLFSGVNTNQCVLGTLLDCYHRGLDCIMLEDCCATNTPGGQDVCIRDVSRGYGFVVDTNSFTNGKTI